VARDAGEGVQYEFGDAAYWDFKAEAPPGLPNYQQSFMMIVRQRDKTFASFNG
jgi:hypothetical protein